VEATLDPNVDGRIGFVDVHLKKDAGIANNPGIHFDATFDVNLADPKTKGDDGRILLSEVPGNFGTVFEFGLNGSLNVPGLLISATVGAAENQLGEPIRISLDGSKLDGGKFDELGDLPAIPGHIKVDNLDKFINFNNITPQMITAALV